MTPLRAAFLRAAPEDILSLLLNRAGPKAFDSLAYDQEWLSSLQDCRVRAFLDTRREREQEESIRTTINQLLETQTGEGADQVVGKEVSGQTPNVCTVPNARVVDLVLVFCGLASNTSFSHCGGGNAAGEDGEDGGDVDEGDVDEGDVDEGESDWGDADEDDVDENVSEFGDSEQQSRTDDDGTHAAAATDDGAGGVDVEDSDADMDQDAEDIDDEHGWAGLDYEGDEEMLDDEQYSEDHQDQEDEADVLQHKSDHADGDDDDEGDDDEGCTIDGFGEQEDDEDSVIEISD